MGTQFVPSCPALVPVTLHLSHINPNNGNCQVDAISELKISAQHADPNAPSVIHENADPTLVADPTLPFCTATYVFDWNVILPGSYTLLLTTKHGAEKPVLAAT